jgi:hypothetical protein
LNGDLANLRKERIEISKVLKSPDEYARRVQIATKKVEEYQRIADNGVYQERLAKEKEYKEITLSLFESVNKTFITASAMLDLTFDYEASKFLTTQQKELHRQAVDNLKEAQNGLNEYKQTIEDAKRMREEAQRVCALAEEKLLEYVREQGGEQAFKTYYQNVVEPAVIEETKELIEVALVRMNFELERHVDNPEVIQLYDQLKANLEKAEEEIISLRYEFDHIEESLRDSSSDFLTNIEKIAKTLSSYFETYMSELEAEGDIQLKKQGTYLQHELQLRVKFRESNEIADLDGNKHSGGERSVSTVMFLMALQELTWYFLLLFIFYLFIFLNSNTLIFFFL